MKKILNISLIVAIILAFASCEKEVIRPIDFLNEHSTNCSGEDSDDYNGQTRDPDDVIINDNGGIVDPDEDDEDLGDSDENDNIVDPDEDDEDLNEKEGK